MQVIFVWYKKLFGNLKHLNATTTRKETEGVCKVGDYIFGTQWRSMEDLLCGYVAMIPPSYTTFISF